ncbi:hypothetical protein DPX16_9847 [Anabarilius grahami]|uniref:Uncharacterized protein n=1 Tax=Anabarilius grahami TaxID=495550 RepID=A0A3N0Y3T1_ANAGA|nr:hypothetical protein DPX16_9847 [Anabarilius grahami]
MKGCLVWQACAALLGLKGWKERSLNLEAPYRSTHPDIDATSTGLLEGDRPASRAALAQRRARNGAHFAGREETLNKSACGGSQRFPPHLTSPKRTEQMLRQECALDGIANSLWTSLEGEDGGTKPGNDAVLAAWLKTFMGATEKPWTVEKRRVSAQDPNENEMKLLGWGAQLIHN